MVTGSRTKVPTVASGFRRSSRETRDITVRFDSETFEQVRQTALREGVSFGEIVRRYVDWGVEAEDE